MIVHKLDEMYLLLACSRSIIRKVDIDKVTEVANKGVDWDYIIRKAQKHCLVPLLYSAIRNLDSGIVSDKHIDALHTLVIANTRRNLVLTAELLQVLKQLDEKGVGAVPYKGSVLAVQAYGNIALRQFNDIDLLIKKRDFEKARKVLVECGYQAYHQYQSDEEREFLRSSHDYLLCQEEKGIFLELQWGVTSRSLIYSLEYDQLTERLESVNVAGTLVRSIAVENQIFALCVHGAKHTWDRIIWICDVAELIRSYPGIDWVDLVDIASRCGGRRMLFLGLNLAHNLLSAEMPQWLLDEINRDSTTQRFAQYLTERIFCTDEDPPKLMGDPRLFYVGLMERFIDRVRLAIYYAQRTKYPTVAARILLASLSER